MYIYIYIYYIYTINKILKFYDDTISYVKTGSITHALSLFNSFDENMKFTFEAENKGTLPLLYNNCLQKEN